MFEAMLRSLNLNKCTGWGGRICKHNVLLMGPDKIVFAGRIILEAILHRLKEWREGPGGTQAAMCKQNACMMGFEKFYIKYAIEASVVDGAMFLQASLHTDSRGGA